MEEEKDKLLGPKEEVQQAIQGPMRDLLPDCPSPPCGSPYHQENPDHNHPCP